MRAVGLLLLVMAGLLAGTSGRRPDRRGWRPGARPSLRSPADPPGQASSPHLTSGSDTTGLWLRSDWADVLRGLLGQDDVSFDAGNGLDLQYSAYVRACVTNCSNQGTCNIFTGRCSCELGWKGEDCLVADHFPCNNPDGVETVSSCFGDCKLGRCYCGHGTKNPWRPMKGVFFREAANMWRNAIDTNDTELMGRWDIDPRQVPRLEWMRGYSHITLEVAKEWCDAQPGGRSPKQMFGCIWPENSGPLCRAQSEGVCVNQCSGRGRCDRGMCSCRPGWYGIDCSLSLRPLGGGEEGEDGRPSLGFAGNKRRPRVFVYELPEVFNVRQLQFRRSGICTGREFSSSGRPRFDPWQYSLDFLLLEWLLHSDYRTADPEEADFFFVPFLTSCYIFLSDDHPRHRVVHGCRAIAAAQAAKLVLHHLKEAYPFWDRRGGADHLWVWAWDEGACAAPEAIRPSIMVSHWGGKYTEPRTAYGPDNWLRPDLPWDNVSKGPFGMAFQDEPVSYLHLMERYVSRGMEWRGHQEERGSADCYDPAKDVVMPPPYWGWQGSQGSLYRRWRSGRLRDPAFNSGWLFYFAGELGVEAARASGQPGGRVEPHYSRGMRQRLAAEFATNEWRTKGIHVYHGRRPAYLDEMAKSVFCGALPGDGWSNAYSWAILHGCIPVLIMDDVELAWATVLDYEAFSVRVTEKDLQNLYSILTAIPNERIAAMQENLRKIWPRFTYVRYRREMTQRMRALGYDTEEMLGESIPESEDLGSDAFDTLMEVLHAKLADRERSEAGGQAM